MNLKALFLFLFVCLIQLPGHSQTTNSLIPQPQELHVGEGSFTLDANTKIYCTPQSEATATLWATYVRKATGFELPLVVKKSARTPKNAISFVLTGKEVKNESYTLAVTKENIVIRSKGTAGLFYGGQTLRQLLPDYFEEGKVRAGSTSFEVPVLNIKDAPRYAWRGYMQDVSRTFYSVDVMKKYIDVMSLYKMNVLHMHLTDDQGWRVEIKKYPRLTEEKATVFPEEFNQPASYSGYYTQEDIKELVRYAAERHVEIVPEIDVPGHSWPVLISYPELAVCENLYPDYIMPFRETYHVWGNQFTPNTLDPTNEAVYTFLNDVFTELAELFPSKYMHFGGDEVRYQVWKEQPQIKAFMKAHKMERIEEVQSYFIERISQLIREKGRQPMGWNDILNDAENLPKGTAIMSWIGSDAVKQAAKYKFMTVATPNETAYFDIRQGDPNDGLLADLSYGHIIRLEDVYSYDPERGLTNDEKKYVLGYQANQWPAVPQDVKDINVQNFPRMLAIAEVGWTTKAKNFPEFKERVDGQLSRLDALKVDYYRPGGHIIATWKPSDLTTPTYTTLEWNVTKKVYTEGRVMAGLFYTKGKNYVNIRRMQLLEDGKVIAEDNHRGFADKTRATGKRKNYLYYLHVKKYNPNAKYTLRAEVSGYNGTDSYGNVICSLSPDVPFSAVEPR